MCAKQVAESCRDQAMSEVDEAPNQAAKSPAIAGLSVQPVDVEG
jgi:hypothetical protein